MNQIIGQMFIIFEKWRYRSQLLLKLRPDEVATLFHWISSRSAHENSNKFDNTIFWKSLSKEISGKSLKFFSLATTKWRPCKTFAKLNRNHFLMANIFKLHKYQTFGLLKMHNMSKIRFAYHNFSLLKSLLYG